MGLRRGRAAATAAGLILGLAQAGAASGGEVPFVAWARTHAVPLPACPATPGPGVAAAIGRTLGDARVLALGEPAHGAHEPLAMRNCLFRFLVEQQGFTAIALESGMGEARALQAYAAGGPGDARRLAREHLSWGFGRFAENAELLQWIHGYNAIPGRRRRIALYGVDMSGGDPAGDWAGAPQVLKAGLDYLERCSPAASAAVRAGLQPFLGRFTRRGYAAMTPAERARLRAAIGRGRNFLLRHRARLTSRSGEAGWAWAERDLVLARQLADLFEASLAEGPGRDLTPQSWRSDEVRDAAMASNLLWVLAREGPRGRVLLFAHNGHVMNAPTRGGVWAVYARAPRSMGEGLRAALGRRVVIVPMSAAAPGPGLPSRPDGLGRLDAALDAAAAGRGDFLLDIRRAKADPAAAAWLARTRSIRTNFTTEQLVRPQRAFDAVIHLDRLTPARAAAPAVAPDAGGTSP